jgi:hypothetical protein
MASLVVDRVDKAGTGSRVNLSFVQERGLMDGLWSISAARRQPTA